MQSDLEQKLINSIYNVTIDIANYDEFMEVWGQEFLQISPDKNAQKPKEISNIVENHFFRAFTILELLGDQDVKAVTIKDMVEADPLPTFILSTGQKTLLANAAAENCFGILAGQALAKMGFGKGDLLKIEQSIDNLNLAKPNVILSIVKLKYHNSEQSMFLALTKIKDENSSFNFLQLSAVQSVWSVEAGEIFKQTFKLSDAELDVARRLVLGKNLKMIAKEKNRSINTIRTQCKNLLAKAKINSQNELIRLFAGLQTYDNIENNSEVNKTLVATPNTFAKGGHNISLENGRNLYYETYGDPEGEAALFMHGVISGTNFPVGMINYLRRRKIKLIAPHRAGFGFSDTNPNKDKDANFIKDMTAILDKENVDKFKIIGHRSGAYYGCLLGSLMPQRLKKFIIVAGTMPYNSTWKVNRTNKFRRILAHTWVFAPKLLPFILRVGIKQFKKTGMEKAMETLYKNSEFDYNLYKKTPEMKEIFINGFELSIAHDVESILNDVTCLLNKKWGQLMDNYSAPIEVFHGRDDPIIPIGRMIELADELDHLNLTIIDGGGEMILYKYYEKLLKDL